MVPDIRGEFQENYRYAHDYWAPFVKNQQIYSFAAAGLTWSNEELKTLQKEGREPLELNIMRRPIQFFSGYLRDNLNSVVVSPVEGSDEKTADQFTKLEYYVWDKANGYNCFLDSCDEMFKTGISLCGLQMDYSKDFQNGDISFYKRPYNAFYLDPTFESLDLKDCGFAITRDLIDRSLLKQLLPFIDPKELEEIPNAFRDDKFLSYHPNFTILSKKRNVVAYDQYYKQVSKKRKMLVDNNSSFSRDITDLSSEELDKLKTGIYRMRKLKEEAESLEIDQRQMPPDVEIVEIEKNFVELNIMLNGIPIYNGEDRTGIVETYPFVPIVCYFEPSIWLPSLRIQGIPSTMYSAQRQFNKRHMKIVDMMDSAISTGYKYLIGSVPDTTDLQQTGQNRIIGVDPENAPQGLDSVQELRGGDASPSLIQYQQILDQLTLTLANVNESVLGIDDKGNTQISGRLAQVRIGQGLRSNRKIFDNIELSQKLLGGLVMTVLQKKYSPSKIKRILGEEPTEQFYNNQFEHFDAVVKEGIRSQSQKDAYYYELVNLKREGIVDVPEASIVKALPMVGTSDLREDIEAQSQMLQKQQSDTLEKQNALVDAQTEQMLGLAQERRARVISDLSLKDERESEAQQNIARAALDRAKAITEIAKMNDERILKALEFINMLEQQEAMGREEQKAQVEVQSNRINAETNNTQEQKQMAQSQQELSQMAGNQSQSS
jgi:hypothetical protein